MENFQQGVVCMDQWFFSTSNSHKDFLPALLLIACKGMICSLLGQLLSKSFAMQSEGIATHISNIFMLTWF